jgi:hypothetical protein
MTKIALVGPSFFAYIEAIRGNLVQRGFETEFFDERHSNRIPVKIMYRLGLYSKFGTRKDRHLDALAARIRQGKFTDVVLIDVEVCDARFVKQLSDAGVRVHLYMWDSAKNKPRYLSYLHLLCGKSSFDPEDCALHGLAYIPLFAEDTFSARRWQPPATPQRPVDVAFCGTLHSNRARRITELLQVARNGRLNVALLLYFHSRWLLAIRSLVDFSFARYLKCVSTVGFTKQQIFELFARSKFVFDLPHPGQVGLTARTFEALRSGTRLITFNKAARDLLPASFATRVFVIESVEELGRLDFSGPSPTSLLSAVDDYYLSLDRFVDQILALIEPVQQGGRGSA